MFLLYIVGLPMLAFLTVRRLKQNATEKRKQVTQSIATATTTAASSASHHRWWSQELVQLSDANAATAHHVWGLLYSSYRDDLWWWELTVVLRKLALALIGVFGASLGDMQVHITLALCVLNLLATAVFQPFGGKSAHVLQKFELLSLLALFLTLWSGSVFNSKPKCVGEQGEVVAWCSVLSVCVGVFDIMVVLGIGLALGFVMRKTKDSSKKEKEGKDSTANMEKDRRQSNRNLLARVYPGNDDRRQKDQQVAIELLVL